MFLLQIQSQRSIRERLLLALKQAEHLSQSEDMIRKHPDNVPSANTVANMNGFPLGKKTVTCTKTSRTK